MKAYALIENTDGAIYVAVGVGPEGRTALEAEFVRIASEYLAANDEDYSRKDAIWDEWNFSDGDNHYDLILVEADKFYKGKKK